MKIFDELHACLWRNPAVNNCNTYLIKSEKNILVDPGHYHLFGHVEDELSALSLSPADVDLVIITHGHPDHMEGIRAFSETPALIALHSIEMNFISELAPRYGQALGDPQSQPHILLKEGDLVVGDLSFRVLHTPGHSPGAICLYWPAKKALFTGDLIFNQGIGRTDLPGGSGERLKESIKRISTLEVDYLLPGHGEVVIGREAVEKNFEEVESYWFAYL